MKTIQIYVTLALLAATAGGTAWGVWYATDAHWRAEYADLKRDYATASTDATTAARERDTARAERVEAAEQVSALEYELQRELARETTREVRDYAQNPERTVCELDSDWVRVHNAAPGMPAPGSDTRAAGGSDASAWSTDAALIGVTDNYGTCALWRSRLLQMQAWADSLPEPN